MINELIKLDKQYFMNTFGDRIKVCFTGGKGIELTSTEGETYYDFFAGIAVNSLGYGNEKFISAMQSQIAKVLHTSNLYYVENQGKLAEKICKSSCADKVFFANSGAEANEGAIKLAKIYHYKKGSGRFEVISLNNSFHGRTLATVAATGQPKYQKPYHPLTPGFVQVEINDIDALKAAITDKTAAIMLEVIQGESGVHPCDKEYIKQVRELCDKNDIILIIDEVQSGMGRTGKLFGFEHFGIEPDIFTLAKALGNGMPVGAVCAKDSVAAAFEPGDHGSTFGGNALACAAGLSVFEIMEEENLVSRAAEMGEYFKTCLNKLKDEFSCIKEVRGIGLMIGVEFTQGLSKKINAALFERHILCGSTLTTLRVLPPLIINKEQIDMFIGVLKDILADL